jgi:hypothetical protein
MTASAWQIRNQQAVLTGSQLSGSLAITLPHSGIRGLVWNQTELDVDSLGVELPEAASVAPVVQDAYTRASDLVVTFADTSQWQLRSQVYWRLSEFLPATAAGVELIVSLQTSLLDAPADISTLSRVASDEIFYLPNGQHEFRELVRSAQPQRLNSSHALGCFVFRLASANVSYAEFVHPIDYRETLLEAVPDLRVDDPATLCRHKLFERRLEKGVILRSRVMGLFLPQDDDLRLARKCYQVFAASEPVLTA